MTIRSEFQKAICAAVAARVRSAGVGLVWLREMVPDIDEVMAGRRMPDAFALLVVAAGAQCRVGDLLRDAGGAG